MNCCNGWCGPNTAITNPLYYQFIPTDDEIEIEIHVDYCSSGSGLQCAIIDACPWDNSNILDCNPGVNPGGTMILHPSGMVIGQVYWLLIDGSNAAVCDFTIVNTSGIFDDFDLPELELDETSLSDTVVCPGYNDLFVSTGPSFPGVHYQWSFDGTIMYDTELPYTYFNLSPFTPDGEYLVCVQAITGCDSTNQICIPITVQSLPDGIRDTSYFCLEEFPFLWNEEVITGAGDYTSSILLPWGCTVDSFWTVYTYPPPDTGTIDTIACDFYFEYEGHHYNQSGSYRLTYPGQGSMGCDSFAHLNLELHYVDAAVDLHCQHEQMVLKSRIIEQDESIDTLTYEWYPCTYDSLLSIAVDYYPGSAGCFSLIVNTSYCQDTIIKDYTINPCEDSLQYPAGTGCVGIEMLLTTPYSLDPDEHADWIIDIPGLPVFQLQDEDSVYINVPIAGSYEAYVTIYDMDDVRTWIGFFDVLARPEVTLCCDQSICSDSCTIVSITETSFALFDVGFTNGLNITSIVGILNLDVCPFEGDPLNYTINHLTYTNLDCPGTVSGDSSITIDAIDPSLVFIASQNDTLCSYPNDLFSYKWRQCDSLSVLSTSPCFAPSISGCYCLEVENEFGCTYETCAPFFLSGTSIIQDDQIKITPNPSNGNIIVELPSAQFPVEWQLRDVEGKFISKGTLISAKSDLQFNTAPARMYFLKFDFGKDGIVVKKIVIE